MGVQNPSTALQSSRRRNLRAALDSWSDFTPGTCKIQTHLGCSRIRLRFGRNGRRKSGYRVERGAFEGRERAERGRKEGKLLSHALARHFRVSCFLPHNFGPRGARKKRKAPLGSSHLSADAGMVSRPISRSAIFAYFASCSVLSGGNALESSREGAELFPAQAEGRRDTHPAPGRQGTLFTNRKEGSRVAGVFTTSSRIGHSQNWT